MKKIDLGLSVKWGSYNIGATKPEEYGGYYQWGGLEDVSKLSYLPEAPYRNPNILIYDNGWIKYNTQRSYGIVDNKKVLDRSDDIANVTLGGSWHIPTDDEWTELKEDCNWEWTTLNNILGYKVTSKRLGYTDNSIFLPGAGCYVYSGPLYQGPYGYYWSSSLNINRPCSAHPIAFGVGHIYEDDSYDRLNSFSIRPVCK